MSAPGQSGAGRPPRPDRTGRAGPVFLERTSYRRRRLTDAVRLIPMLGAFLWALPLMWARGGTSSSAALLYLFGVWAVLVLGAALLSWGMRGIDWTGNEAGPAPENPDGEGDSPAGAGRREGG